MRIRLSPIYGTLFLIAAATGAMAWSWQSVLEYRAPMAPTLPELDSVGPVKDEGESGNVPAPRPPVYYSAITLRPLFAPSRRPGETALDGNATALVEPEVDPVDPAPSALPVLGLKGTVFTDAGWAALVAIGDQPAEWLNIGAEAGGFQLVAVGPDWAEFSSSDTELKLELYP